MRSQSDGNANRSTATFVMPLGVANLQFVIWSIAFFLSSIHFVQAMESDDPLLTMVKVDQLEWRINDGPDPAVFEGEGWIVHDLHKLWFKGGTVAAVWSVGGSTSGSVGVL